MNTLFNPYTSSELFSAWQERKRSVDAEQLMPYADLLLDQVVWPEMLVNKDQILSALKDRIKTATATYELTVPIWSFSTVFGVKMLHLAGGIAHHNLVECGNADAVAAKWVHENAWDYQMEVELETDEEEVIPLYKKSLYHIIKKTTFLNELSLRFGADFRVTLDEERLYETAPNGKEVVRSLFTLNLHYHPYGLPESYAKQLAVLQTRLLSRSRRTLKPNEVLRITKGDELVKKVLGPLPLFDMYASCRHRYYRETESEE